MAGNGTELIGYRVSKRVVTMGGVLYWWYAVSKIMILVNVAKMCTNIHIKLETIAQDG